MKNVPILFVLLLLFFVGCETRNVPPVKLEEQQVSCSINGNFKATMDNYFQTVAVKKEAFAQLEENAKRYGEARPLRVIILRKTKAIGEHVNISVLVYTVNKKVRIFENSFMGNSLSLDMVLQVGSDVLLWDDGDNKLIAEEVYILSERAMCIPDSISM